jgi:hypothetical protein
LVRWPTAKIGLPLGAPSNLIAVETRGKTGRRKLRELTVDHGTLPRTVTISLVVDGFISTGLRGASRAVLGSAMASGFLGRVK